MTFYVCNEDMPNSALYLRRERHHEWWGKCGPVDVPIHFGVVEYKRVTCAPNEKYTTPEYTTPESGWFTQTFSERQNKFVDTYKPLGFIEGYKLWWKQRSYEKSH
jgi:hypothetical protein